MNLEGLLWVLAFSAALLLLNFVHSKIWKCLNDKPLGLQSVFDAVLKDNLVLLRLHGSIGCLVTIVGRFSTIQNFMVENPFCLLLIILIHQFFLFFLMVHVGFLSICRVLCISNMAFVEETVGETRVRMISLAASAMISSICVFILWYSDNILLGAITTFLTGKFSSPGNTPHFVINSQIKHTCIFIVINSLHM